MNYNLNQYPTRNSAVLTLPEVCELLKVSKRTVLRWIRYSGLKCLRIGNITRVTVKDLEEFLEKNTVTGVQNDHKQSGPAEI